VAVHVNLAIPPPGKLPTVPVVSTIVHPLPVSKLGVAPTLELTCDPKSTTVYVVPAPVDMSV
jgi:hypothetical protein